MNKRKLSRAERERERSERERGGGRRGPNKKSSCTEQMTSKKCFELEKVKQLLWLKKLITLESHFQAKNEASNARANAWHKHYHFLLD